MSTWHVRAIERLGTPLPGWPTIWGPAAPGADPIAANGLRTVDLTPYLSPLQDFTSILERDLTRASYGSVGLDLVDADESLAVMLGPFSSTMATPTRYFGPWIQITEAWPTGSAVRWTGYLDETSIQWDEAGAITRCTVLHASQLLRERKLKDIESLARPFPKAAEGTVSHSFTQSTGDDLLAERGWVEPRPDRVAREQALWADGALTWQIALKHTEGYREPPAHPREDFPPQDWPLPTPPAASLIIGGETYPILDVVWSSDLYLAPVVVFDEGWEVHYDTISAVVIRLLGAPNLTGLLHLGDTVSFGQTEEERTHYVLAEAVPEPPDGGDGQRWIRLDTLDELIAGDVLTITFKDAADGTQRRATMDAVVIDTDGETGRVWLRDPVDRALPLATVIKIRRNSRDPRQFDGVAYAAAAVAPFGLDASHLVPAETGRPIVTWMPHDRANPHLYGIRDLQTTDRSGGMRISRRGPLRVSDGAYPSAGLWVGNWLSGFNWTGLPSASAPLEILGDLNQWPGGSNAWTPPVIYVQGELTGGATVPTNGWRAPHRSWAVPGAHNQDVEAWWDGTEVQWAPRVAVGIIPPAVVAFCAQTLSPGCYSRTSAGSWSFRAHSAPGTLGASVTPSVSGSPPSGNWICLGMGLYGPVGQDEQEALLGLVTPGSTLPFTSISAVLLAQSLGGNLTVRQSIEMWNDLLVTPAGSWALGGGLVVQTWVETLQDTSYPHTRLHLLDGVNHTWGDFATYEIIPQTIQPLALGGPAGARTVEGWLCLALETYLDDNFVASRRLRFLRLDRQLGIVNGEFTINPLFPTVLARYGDVISETMPDGAVPCRMVRTGVGNEMAGFFGGRLFAVTTALPTTVERLKVGDLSAADYLEHLSRALLASAIPDANGNIRMVSRGAGALRIRDTPFGRVSVQASERGPRRTTQAYQGYISEVRVNYTDVVSGDQRDTTIQPAHAGGKPMSVEMGSLVGSITAAMAIGEAMAAWFGVPSSVLSETWIDRTTGWQADQNPAWWSTWDVGDLVAYSPSVPGVPIQAYKIHQFKRGPETRSVQVELIKLPIPILGV